MNEKKGGRRRKRRNEEKERIHTAKRESFVRRKECDKEQHMARNSTKEDI